MKMRKRYRPFLLALCLCLSLTACGGPDGDIAGGDWRTTGVVDAYGTVARDGEEIGVCACLGPKAVYLYYDNEKHELFDTAVLPTDELGDEDWQFGEMSLSDFSGDYNSDLRLTLFHEDMSESYIVWEWEKGAGYLYQPSDSYFRESRVIVGRYVLTAEDIIACRRFGDAIAVAGYPVDIHHAKGGDCTMHFCDDSYDIPYRCLLPERVAGLLVAGRCSSMNHEAMASTRVMSTCMALGEAAGRAARLALKAGVQPADLDVEALRAELRATGAYLRD